MGKRIVLGVIVFFLLVLSMVILKSKWVMEKQFIKERMVQMERRGQEMMKLQRQTVVKAEGLVGAEWVWEMTVGNDKKVVKPKADSFALIFGSDGKLSTMTDCNDFTGTYKLSGGAVQVGDFIGTKKYCEGSQEEMFTKMMMNVGTYTLDGTDSLVLMMEDGGAMYFARMTK